MHRSTIRITKSRLPAVHNSSSLSHTWRCPKKKAQQTDKYPKQTMIMAPQTDANGTGNQKVAPENTTELNDEELSLFLNDAPSDKKAIQKKRKRQQGIIGLIKSNPQISIEEMAERLNAGERTIHRDMEELKPFVEHIGPNKGGSWVIKLHKK